MRYDAPRFGHATDLLQIDVAPGRFRVLEDRRTGRVSVVPSHPEPVRVDRVIEALRKAGMERRVDGLIDEGIARFQHQVG